MAELSGMSGIKATMHYEVRPHIGNSQRPSPYARRGGTYGQAVRWRAAAAVGCASEHDFTTQPLAVAPGDATSLPAPLLTARVALEADEPGPQPGFGG